MVGNRRRFFQGLPQLSLSFPGLTLATKEAVVRISLLLVSALLCTATGGAASQVSLSWDASPDEGVTGYFLYYGFATRNYVGTIDVGTQTTATVSNLSSGQTYYFAVTAYNASVLQSDFSGEVSYTVPADPPPPPPPLGGTTVTFTGENQITQGSWKQSYGADGYEVVGDTARYPSYATVTAANKSDWTWQSAATGAGALQRATRPSRIAACWYSATGLSLDVNILDGGSHSLSLYFLDWDNAGRIQSIEVLDASNGALLDSRTIAGFANGIYLTWALSGHIKINIVSQVGNAVLSGIFFGAATPSTESPAAPTISPNGGSFTARQTVTLGTVSAGAEIRYTLDGMDPSETSILYQAPFTLSTSAVVRAKAFQSGIASPTSSATFTITPPTGSGSGAKVLFFGVDAHTQGNWYEGYGTDGFEIFGEGQNYPDYAQMTAVGKLDWIWQRPTADIRALASPDYSQGRVAACWNSSDQFEIDLNLQGSETHRLAMYVCDWDLSNRSERVEVLDPFTGELFHSLVVSNFDQGQYLIWDIRGHVKIQVTRLQGPNAVASGLFLGPTDTEL